MQRLYLDTSVFGGYFEPEFEVWTKRMFERILEESLIVVVSPVTLGELQRAPQHVRDLPGVIPIAQVEYVPSSLQAEEFAEMYIRERVVGKTSFQDCMHIAIDTLHRADALVSWNFKHIANLTRIRGYNAVNYREGHPMIEIRTPFELMYHAR